MKSQVLRKKSVKPRLLTITLRNARGGPVESTEGDVMSATKELGAIKNPDEQCETAPARDTREDSAESTGG
jgi:hypothetical protein